MTLIVTLDDNGGMLFGGRRQSRDRVLSERIAALAADKRLLVSAYSASLFPADTVTVDDNYADNAASGDVVFVENGALPLDAAARLIVYRWNRHYPSDQKFPLEVLTADFTLQQSQEFVGSSHDTITEEIYVRR